MFWVLETRISSGTFWGKECPSSVSDVSQCWRSSFPCAAFCGWNVRGLWRCFANVRSQKLLFRFGRRTKGSRKFDPGRSVSLTQGEASTFTVLREVLAFRDLIVYIKDDSYNSWSLVTSVSFHAVFTGRIELNRLTMSLNLPLTIWLLGLSFGMKSLSYDFQFWVIRQIACVIVTWRSMNKSWIVVFSR